MVSEITEEADGLSIHFPAPHMKMLLMFTTGIPEA